MKICFFLMISSILLSAQSWFPLHKDNKHQVYYTYVYGTSNAVCLNYAPVKDTLINNVKYFYNSLFTEFYNKPFRYDSVEQKVYFYDNGDIESFSFNYPVDVFFDVNLGSGNPVNSRFTNSIKTIAGKTKNAKKLELRKPYGQWVTYEFIQDIGIVGKGTVIGAYIISGRDTLQYNHSYYPYFPPENTNIPDTIRNFNLNFRFAPSHYYSFYYSQVSANVNYIDTVWCEGYYKKGNDSTGKVIVKKTAVDFWYFDFFMPLNSTLINNGYDFYFNVFAKDKGMWPHISAKYPDYKKLIYSPVVSVGNENYINNLSLEQNYPNPFNPSTVISYSIPERQMVTLKVYDVLGNEVSELINQEQSAGLHSIEFKAAHLSSGVYIYQLKFGSKVKTKRMMLIK